MGSQTEAQMRILLLLAEAVADGWRIFWNVVALPLAGALFVVWVLGALPAEYVKRMAAGRTEKVGEDQSRRDQVGVAHRGL